MRGRPRLHRESRPGGAGGSGAAEEWSQARLAGVLAMGATAVLAVLVGLGLLVVGSVTDAGVSAGEDGTPVAAADGGAGGAGGVDGDGDVPGEGIEARRDRLAAEPMTVLSLDAAKPQSLSTQVAAVMYVPMATGVDELGVAIGHPRTPEGAVGQLGAITRAAITSAGLAQTRAVIRQWGSVGGPTEETWYAVQGMRALFSAAALPADHTSGLIDWAPSIAMVKATDGPDWVLACVNGTLTVEFTNTVRVAASNCQRMVWDDDPVNSGGGGAGRWVIGPGVQPVASPSAWPGSQVAIEAGWQELRDA